MDPTEQYSPDEILKALYIIGHPKYHLIKDKLEMNIEAEVFNSTDLKLLCLARALLFKTPIILIDDLLNELEEEEQILIVEAVLKSLPESTIIWTFSSNTAISQMTRTFILNNGQVIEAN